MNQNRLCLLEADVFSPPFFRSLRGALASLAILFAALQQAPALFAQEPAAPAAEAPAEETEKKPEAEDEPATTETPPADAVNPEKALNREKVVADEEGRIQFNYAGQPWSQVLQDYADAASFSLDWQELPTDTLNLTTQRTYSLAEARDLLNRHLLARGFTMLTEGEVLSVVKVDKLDPSLIPRATAANLKDYAAHDFMRITFDLPPVMDPAKAAEDAKLLLSPNAKVTPLLASRRLLVIDAVANLREVSNLLSAEREEDRVTATPREYVLKYRRADYVAEQVLVVLGLDPNVIKTPDELKLETQRIQMQMKLIEKAKDVSKMIKNDGPKVHVAVNRRRNSILVNAPADLMGIVERTVKQLDVPDVAGEEGEAALSLKQYQLVVADPSEIIKALQDIVRLNPRSRLQGDSGKKSLLATATEADHGKILEIIAKLDVTMPDTVEVEKLGEQDPHDFVRVRFQLPFGMNPSSVARKVQPLLSGNSKVLSLPTSRRLMIVDTVENLLEVRELIDTEVAAFASKDSLREFVMQHRRADEVAAQVLTMLGLSPAGLSNSRGARFDYQGINLYVSVNKKSNSFRVSSSPELLELIEQTVKRFDIAETVAGAEGEPAQTIVLYRVVGQNIPSLITMLRDLGDVGPLARLQTGPARDTLYAIASAEDHEKISLFLKTIAPRTIKMVEPESLESLPPQELVRVRFQMPLTALVSTTAAQLRRMTTPRGIVQSFESSKQLIVLDTAENLINIREVLKTETAALKNQSVIKEFPLEHRSASEMVEQVLAMVGLDPATVRSPYQLRVELKAMKFFITANQQRNSLIVNTSPDKLELVEKIIAQLDVPQTGPQQGDADRLSMVPYKVTGQNVTVVAKTLKEIGNLSPRTRLQADPLSQTLYAYADQTGHEIIRQFLDKIDPHSVRRVDAGELETYPAQQRVRVRFQLPLTADVRKTATQIRGVLGIKGRVQSLEASKQLIVDDTVSNLIEVRDLLLAENKAIASPDVFQEFHIKHRRAEEMAEQILTMLELNPRTISSPQGARYNYRGMKLFVSIKPKRNALLVGARQELIQVVDQIIKQFDVPERASPATGDDVMTLVLYNVPGQNLSSVIKMLGKLADLGPLTRIDVGPASETIYSIANQEDHKKIRAFLEKIAPNQIPSIDPSKLEELPSNELARVLFQLPHSANAANAAAQVRGVLGPQGRVQSLELSKQILVVDTINKLIEVRKILKAEELALDSQQKIREFSLKHRRAKEMVEQVLTMLGLDPETVSSPYQLRRELQQMKVFITANQQRNSLVVNAAADKLALVERIVTQLDVPQTQTEGALEDANRLSLVPYELEFIDAISAEKALTEIAGLSPRVRLQADSAKRTLYAYATREDHMKIEVFLQKTKPKGKRIHRIEPEMLEQYSNDDRGRVLFQLPLLADVEQSARQIRGILGREGVVQALANSKQLMVVDKVEVLLEVRNVLRAEEMALKSQKNIREFPLKHRRAPEMVEKVLAMLGVNPELITNPRQLQQELQRLKLFITANHQRNSLVVNAQADKMQTVEQIVTQLDVPQDDETGEVVARQTMVPYRIAVGDVASVAKVLTDIGNLAPRTRLQSDLKNKTLYAYASKADHQKIRQFVDEMDPNIVRRVAADDLEENSAHEIVRVIFQLPLSSDIGSSATQVKGMLGGGARVQSLKLSKQLVVVDTVANLIDVRDLLYGEQLAAEALEMPRVFSLSHRRAAYVADQVMILLGLDPSARKTSSEVNFEAQRMQMMIQEASRQGRDISKIGGQSVFIAVNLRQNSLLVNAPAEKIPLIERTIEQIDVPVLGSAPVAIGPLTMEKYQMVTAGSDGVIRALEEIGNLAPMTQLQTDETGKIIYAYATVADHEVIKRMIDKLDGTGRRPEVRWLAPNLPADQVAGSIMSLVVGPKKKKKNNLPWYFYRNNNDDEEDESNDGFRVLPDVENNRLLLWATDGELKEVDDFIAKLSEPAAGQFNDLRKVRRLEARDPETTRKLLEQLRSSWPGKNKLEIEAPPTKEKPEEKLEEPTEDDKLTSTDNRLLDFSQPTWLAQAAEEPAVEEPAPPIKISINERGEIVLASDDTVALDRLQSLIELLSPVQTEFKSFQLRYIHVSDALYNLEDYFEDQLGDQGKDILDWWGRRQQTKPAPKPMTLGKRPPLRFVDDVRTNTLIVSNASPSQMDVIEEMIKLYDQPPNPDLYYQRRTEAIKIKYSQASDIAESLKEVYRDLLSSKDKEFRTKDGKQAGGPSRESSYIFGNARRTVHGSEGPVLVRFSGALSIGVDNVSNSVVISAREEVLEEIKNTITVLDKAAKTATVVRIHSASGVLDAAGLQRVIAEALSEPWVGGQPATGSSGKKSRGKRLKSRGK